MVEGSKSEKVGAAVPPQRTWAQSRMLNVWVDDLTMDQLMAELREGVVFTLNPDHLHLLQHNREFYDAYSKADFITSRSKLHVTLTPHLAEAASPTLHRTNASLIGSSIHRYTCASELKGCDITAMLPEVTLRSSWHSCSTPSN